MEVKNHMISAFFGLRDGGAFSHHMQKALGLIATGGVFVGDNLFTFAKNLSFLHDAKFMEAFHNNTKTLSEQALIWRYYTLCWAAKRSLRYEGDFLECACYQGNSAHIVADYLDFAEINKAYYLYDLFDHPDEAVSLKMEHHGADLYDRVCKRFEAFDDVHVTRGRVPDILDEVAPEKIAFMHIDVNDPEAELGALEKLFDRVSPGGTVVLDDYGWSAYHEQKTAEDAFFAERDYQVFELPTGQGLLIK